jgi:hypothetical protein
LENRVCLSCGVQVVGAAWHVVTRIVARVGDLVMWSAGFLVEPQNQGLRFVSGLVSKPLGRFSLVCPQNRW